MFFVTSVFLSSFFSSEFLEGPGLPLFAAGFRTTPGKGELDGPLSFSSVSSLAGLQGPPLPLAPNGTGGPFWTAAFLEVLSSSWESSVLRDGFWPKVCLGNRGLGSASCAAGMNLLLAPATFENPGFTSFSGTGGVGPGFDPGVLKSDSWFKL